MIVDLSNEKEAEGFVSAKFFEKFGKDPDQLRQEAEAGSAAARRAFEEFGRNLGVVIANLVNLLDPEAIILGGGIASASALFLDEARAKAGRLIVNPDSKRIPLLKAALGPAAGAVGAALLAKIR